MRTRKLGWMALSLLLVAASSGASDGDLDPGFGVGGRWTWAAPGGTDPGTVVGAPDGALVATGGWGPTVGSYLPRYLYWKRMTATTAGTSCVAVTGFNDGAFAYTAAGFDSAGRLLVAGGYQPSDGHGGIFEVVRSLYPGCTLDNAFGFGGVASVASPGVPNVFDIREILVDTPSGGSEERIQVLGAEEDSYPWYAVVLRLTSSGAPDTTWGSGGLLFWGRSHPGVDPPLDLMSDATQDAAGRLLALGDVGSELWISRKLANGDRDDSFGTDGEVLLGFGSPAPTAGAAAVVPYPDGRILVVGSAFDGSGDTWIAVARLRENGTLDPSFGASGSTPGKVLIRVDPTATESLEVRDAKIQGDGRIVIVGGVARGGDQDVFAVRLRADGALDSSFGGDGRVILAIDLGGSLDDLASSVTFQSGRPVLMGAAAYPDSRRAILLRLQSSYLFADGFESGDARAWGP